MNCLEFRRAALAAPRELPAEAREHAATCEACRAALSREIAFDDRLHEAMRTAVPEALADRVLVAQGLRRRAAWPWGLAATAVLAAVIGWAAPPMIAGRGLAHEAIAHVEAEPQSLRIRNAYPREQLVSLLAAQGLRLAGDVGEVTYLQHCPMGESVGEHLVLATPEGPVTLLLLPRDETRRRAAEVSDRGRAAMAAPAPRGSLAIVAASGEQARAFARRIVPA
jgi:hypothetical protein